jgi:hypothetical protein
MREQVVDCPGGQATQQQIVRFQRIGHRVAEGRCTTEEHGGRLGGNGGWHGEIPLASDVVSEYDT